MPLAQQGNCEDETLKELHAHHVIGALGQPKFAVGKHSGFPFEKTDYDQLLGCVRPVRTLHQTEQTADRWNTGGTTHLETMLNSGRTFHVQKVARNWVAIVKFLRGAVNTDNGVEVRR